MPVYEYKCSCGYSMEKIVYSYESNSAVCPRCNNEINRGISNNTFILKGSGWCKDGYQ